MIYRKMQYDPFQKQAIDYINQGFSVIVSAPTGAGKTVIAEHVINDCIAKKKRVIYTAPIKALSNQKFRDFQKTFPEEVGILTGDVSINPHGSVLIMTTEIFRNKVLEEEANLDEYSWIIFDEIHYLDDYERGSVWEESLIFLPKNMNMLALSATIPNIDEFARWIESIHKKPIKVVKESLRPVPLHFFYQCQGKIVDSTKKVKGLAYEKSAFFYSRGRKFFKHGHLKPNRLDSLAHHLQDEKRLPCIYFAFSRRRTEYLAEEMQNFNFLTEEEKNKIKHLFKDLCEHFGLTAEQSAHKIRPLIERGIAYHHAGMLPTLKEVIERLFTSRLIKVIFTTETFALGINMPARTVVFDELRKFYGRFFSTLKTRDFYQMAGRAGRRGIDKEGFVYTRINPRFINFEELKDTIYGEPEEVRSRFNASYATVLNLYDRYGEKLYGIYPFSFHYFQENKKAKDRAVALLRAKVGILKELGYIKNERLTEKGYFAGKVYGYELSLTELYTSGFLNNLSEIELGILCLALVFEPRKGDHQTPVTKKAGHIHKKTEEILGHINYLEKKYRISPLSKKYYFQLAPSLEAWMKNEPFDSVLRLTGTDEGELIRYFRMCAQILREILDTPATEELKQKTKIAMSLINRDIVDAEKQLRA
ncbi:MAG: DEAD/DEAH box helicase [Candidatus Omnitrophica bacterium]|nr:DEAD/DEAH box helicase [Candidatus Omnitrophota bacterium]